MRLEQSGFIDQQSFICSLGIQIVRSVNLVLLLIQQSLFCTWQQQSLRILQVAFIDEYNLIGEYNISRNDGAGL